MLLNKYSYGPLYCLNFEIQFPVNAIKILCAFVLHLICIAGYQPAALLLYLELNLDQMMPKDSSDQFGQFAYLLPFCFTTLET